MPQDITLSNGRLPLSTEGSHRKCRNLRQSPGEMQIQGLDPAFRKQKAATLLSQRLHLILSVLLASEAGRHKLFKNYFACALQKKALSTRVSHPLMSLTPSLALISGGQKQAI